MVRYRRHHLPGGTYVFTVTLADRRSSALVDRAGALRAAFRATKATAPFAIDAIVILPDHLHAILSLPEDDADYPNRWRRIKGHFTSAAVAGGLALAPDAKGGYRLWQHRYWEHTIRDEDDFTRRIDDIHINPVKHGSVTNVIDWPHSSFHRYVRNGNLPVPRGRPVVNVCRGLRAKPYRCHKLQQIKVFCFFFSKKKTFLTFFRSTRSCSRRGLPRTQ